MNLMRLLFVYKFFSVSFATNANRVEDFKMPTRLSHLVERYLVLTEKLSNREMIFSCVGVKKYLMFVCADFKAFRLMS